MTDRSFVRPLALAALALPALAAARSAQDTPDLAERVRALEQKNAALEQKLEAVADDQERWQLGDLAPAVGESHHGLGPAASKVYEQGEGLSIGGYGEALYQHRNGDAVDEIDLLRAVLYFGYHFSPNWVFNSEIEFEHAGEEVGVEFAYLDYLYGQALNFRGGLVLVPMGFLNELHEPNTFLGATRGEVERRILPSTWREPGVGVFGDVGPVAYRLFLVDGFDATGFDATGLREGRQEGSEARAEDFALVARADWSATPGLLAGLSLYHGDSGQQQPGLEDTTVDIAELHAQWRAHGLWVRALATESRVDDVAALNAAGGLVGTDSVGEEMRGWYVEGGYDVLSVLDPDGDAALYPFARYESIDTQAEVPSGFASDPANDSDVFTLGLHYQPIPGLVFKAEYQDFEDAEDGINLSTGYVF